MKKKIFIIVLLFKFNSLYPQNLVSNPSFEDTTSTPIGIDITAKAIGWSSYGESPDYFNSAFYYNNNMFSVPRNIWGTQQAFDGNAYAGIATYVEAGLFPGIYREFIGTKLVHPLSIGTRYYLTAYISRADSTEQHGASNNFCFRFFNRSYSLAVPCPVDNFSHFKENNIITDSLNWTKISGSFIADSAYEYLALGNFYDDQHTDTMDMDDHIQNFENCAYYYIDYVCVTEDSLNCSIYNGIKAINNKGEIRLYPNPFINNLEIKLEENKEVEIIFYDIFSRKVLDKKFIKSAEINTQFLDEGVYIYNIFMNRSLIKEGIVVKE